MVTYSDKKEILEMEFGVRFTGIRVSDNEFEDLKNIERDIDLRDYKFKSKDVKNELSKLIDKGLDFDIDSKDLSYKLGDKIAKNKYKLDKNKEYGLYNPDKELIYIEL